MSARRFGRTVPSLFREFFGSCEIDGAAEHSPDTVAAATGVSLEQIEAILEAEDDA